MIEVSRMRKMLASKTSVFLVMLFSAMLTHSYVFSWDYHMDDAWIIGISYLHQSIFTQEGLSSALSSIVTQHNDQWQRQGRFLGVLPVLRVIQVYVSSDVLFHLVLNVIFHALNALLMFILLRRDLRVSEFNAFCVSLFFACSLNLSSGMYSLTVWIGSDYINILTLFLLMYFAYVHKSVNPWAFYLVNSVYFLVALGNFTLAVIAFPLVLLLIGYGFKMKSLVRYVIYLIAPVGMNLAIRSFAPPSSYIGTSPNYSIEHTFNNFINIYFVLLGGSGVISVAFTVLLVLGVLYILISGKQEVASVVAIVSLTFGYILLYSLSSRTHFDNPYFLYLPYFGLVLLVALILNELRLPRVVLPLLLVAVAVFHYSDSLEYRKFRYKTAVDVSALRDEFKELINQVDQSGKLVILLYEDYLYASYPLGFHSSTFNTWKDRVDSNFYEIATDYIMNDNQLLFRIGVNQYGRVFEDYLSIDEILRLRKIYSSYKDHIEIIYIDKYGGAKRVTVEELPSRLYFIESTHSTEIYGDGSMYLWGDGKMKVNLYHKESDFGKHLLLSLCITSLFDDIVQITGDGFSRYIGLQANKPKEITLVLNIDSPVEVLTFKSDKFIVPVGDSRKLSFRIDYGIDYYVVDSLYPFEIDSSLSSVRYSGFYDQEDNFFRWVSSEAKLSLPFFPSANNQNVTLELRGSFPGGAPIVSICDRLADEVVSVGQDMFRYRFIGYDGPFDCISFYTHSLSVARDPRDLGFMFHKLVLFVDE